MEFAKNTPSPQDPAPKSETGIPSSAAMPSGGFARDLLIELPTMEVSWPTTEIKTKKQLENLCAALMKEPLFSLDTETGGEKGESLDTRLSIIQIGIPKYKKSGEVDPERGKVFVIDALALKAEADAQSLRNRDGMVLNPLAPLKNVLESAETEAGQKSEKLIHFSQFEQAQFRKYGIEITGVKDTLKIAKALRPELESAALAACSVEFLGKSLSKEEQTSDWLIRPLSESQFKYAALDAQILFTLYAKLQKIERAVEPRKSASPEELIEDMRGAVMDSLRLVRGEVGNSYMTSLMRSQKLKEALKESLSLRIPPGEVEFVPDEPYAYGSASIKCPDAKELNVGKFEAKLPAIAEELKPFYSATKKDVTEALLAELKDSAKADAAAKRIFNLSKWASPSLKMKFDFSEEYGAGKALVMAAAEGLISGPRINSVMFKNLETLAKKARPDLIEFSPEALALEVLNEDISLPAEPLSSARLKKHGQRVDAVLGEVEKRLREMNAEANGPVVDEPNLILREMIFEAKKRSDILRNAGIGDKYGPCQYRIELAGERLVEMLAPNLGENSGRFEYPAPAGTAALSRRAMPQMDLDYFRATFPDAARQVLAPTKTRIVEALKSKGIDSTSIEEIFKEIEDDAGKGDPRFSCYPKFKLLYVPHSDADSASEERA